MKVQSAEGRDGTVVINIRPNAVSVTLDEIDVLTFDRSGRLVTAVIGGHTYRRGLDGRILHKWRESAVRCRELLDTGQARALLERIHDSVESTRSALGPAAHDPARMTARETLSMLLCRSGYEALEQDAARHRLLYRPVSILPPDQYLSLVLQVTEGCHYNRCTFCGFYRDRPFRIKSLAEFRSHMEAVVNFLGDGLSLRRSVFLADANALCIPRDRLLPVLDSVNARFLEGAGPGLTRLRGICSFTDVFSRGQRTGPEYAELRDRNVKRLYLGVESGSDRLLRFLQKPQTREEVRDAVYEIKDGGLNIGVILMLGIGGETYRKEHVDQSVELLNSLPWTTGDMVFLSALIEFPGSPYPELAREAGVRPLSGDEMRRQYEDVRGRIARRNGYPIIAPYNAEEFIY